MNGPSATPSSAARQSQIEPQSEALRGDRSLPPSRSHFAGVGRHTLGISLLLVTVFLWTASSFLASDIFADHTYSKPYFVTYINSSFFAVLLLPVLLQRLLGPNSLWRHLIRHRSKDTKYALLAEDERNTVVKTHSEDGRLADSGNLNDGSVSDHMRGGIGLPEGPGIENVEEKLSIRDTAWLSFEFSILWFLVRIEALQPVELHLGIGTGQLLYSCLSELHECR
ncbi:hypothetical protein XPA_000503 [Xanthoria parietina]